MAIIDLDLSSWPIVVTRPRGGVLQDHELTDYIERFRTEIKRRTGRYVSILDLRDSPTLTPVQRRTISNGMDEDRASTRQCVGAAMVFESAIMRGLLTAILWLRQPKYEVKVFGDVQAAKAWACERLSSQQRAAHG
jgi:hypothetical protein